MSILSRKVSILRPSKKPVKKQLTFEERIIRAFGSFDTRDFKYQNNMLYFTRGGMSVSMHVAGYPFCCGMKEIGSLYCQIGNTTTFLARDIISHLLQMLPDRTGYSLITIANKPEHTEIEQGALKAGFTFNGSFTNKNTGRTLNHYLKLS